MEARIGPTWRGSLLVLLIAAGGGAACNGSSAPVPKDGSTGADAQAERNGTGGGAGTGGEFPPGCLRDLFAPCSIAGSCTYQDEAGNRSYCYASGAGSTSTGTRCSTNGPSVETATITKPDGTLCYTVSITASPWQACEDQSYRWSDANGATVATGTTGPGVGISILCEVGGETAMSSGTQPYLIFTSGQCSPGNCP